MSTHSLKLHGRTTSTRSLARPARAFHRLERRWRHRDHGSAAVDDSVSTAPAPDAGESRPVRIGYWTGDERETTQGDW